MDHRVALFLVSTLLCPHPPYSQLVVDFCHPQVLVNELRQPELEEGDTTNSLAVILAEHANGHGENRVGLPRTGRRSRLPRPA